MWEGLTAEVCQFNAVYVCVCVCGGAESQYLNFTIIIIFLCSHKKLLTVNNR